MRIGVFDSGLGGLAIAQAIMRRLPDYDYLYLGDTKRVPYGGRSQETIHEFVSEALNYLFANDCHLVILACNTASAEALRKTQQEYLPERYPERRVLGVVIPTAEATLADPDARRVGVLATQSTCDSDAYGRELRRLREDVEVVHRPAPLLVPIVEADGFKYAGPILDDYLHDLGRIDRLILGCTHYCLLKEQIRARTTVPVLSQDEIVPDKLADYLRRHPEHEARLGRGRQRLYRVTDITPTYRRLADAMAGEEVRLERVSL
ncbi:MAG TPA: glutamate racemase [Fimbriimonas sp.]